MENTLLNLIPAAYLPEVHISQYDIGRTLTFNLKEGASDYDVPTGATVTVKATKPSGFGFAVPCTFSGGVVTLVVTETMTPEYGRFPAELSIVSGNTTIGTSNFIFNIERSPHPEGTIDGDAESLLPELTLLVERIEAAADSVDEDTQTVTEAKAEVLQAKADTLQAKADTLTARDDALQAKADAITAKESAEASAQAAAESAQEAEDTLSEYAKVDGYYEEMAVGSAEQLLSTQFVEDSVPYKFRTSGGSKDIGNREYDEIVGGTVAWNQLSNPQNYAGTGLTISVTDGRIALTGETTSGGWFGGMSMGAFSAVANHVYLIMANNLVENDSNPLALLGNYTHLLSLTSKPQVITKNTSGYANYYFAISKGSGKTFDKQFTPQAFDLTQMFGSTVADYIYSLESAEAGKGVAFFKSLFPNDYYPYNAGELLSVEGLQSHDTVGFNQWDEEWELGNIDVSSGQNTTNANNIRSKNYIPVLPNTTYYLMCGGQATFNYRFYDSDKNYISGTYIGRNNTLTIPSGVSYMRFYMGDSYGKVYNNDICINLSWSGWRNGEYEPYKKHSYPLDSSLTLRGISKLNAQNELYFDGDIYSHDGTVTRKYGIVDLGTLTWQAGTDSIGQYFQSVLSNAKVITSGVANILCAKYVTTSSSSVADKQIAQGTGSGKALYIHDTAYTSASDFKTAMSGVMLIYELATPTEETAEPYASPQNVDDFGTEEYISGNLVPVGHNTQYPANLRDKLQHLPNLADNDGYYMISQQNKQMSLELFRIPKAPTTDGTYILKATVSGGTPTYTWEAVE